ncbi:MAG: hypothetical protein ACFCU4_02945 [Puniceicoccaceae bacterium]
MRPTLYRLFLLLFLSLFLTSAAQAGKWRENKPYVLWFYYGDLHTELLAEFGYDDNELRQHFAEIGLDLGLRSSPVMDVRWYLETNPDLQRAFGRTNYRAALAHWRKHGMTEGRPAHPGFDPKWYLANNPDVLAWVGSKEPFRRAVEHYMNYGYFEGRRGSPLSAGEIAYRRPDFNVPTTPGTSARPNPNLPTQPQEPGDGSGEDDPADPNNGRPSDDPNLPGSPTEPSPGNDSGVVTIPGIPSNPGTTPRPRIIR